MLRLAQQKQELDLQRLKQEGEQIKKEQALMLAELEEDNRGRLAEATLTNLKLSEDVLETSRSLRDALSELSAHSQTVKSVKLNNWVTNVSTEVKNRISQKQDSTVDTVDLKTDCNQVHISPQQECLPRRMLPTLRMKLVDLTLFRFNRMLLNLNQNQQILIMCH